MNGAQKRALGKSVHYYMYSDMAKGTSQAEVMSNYKKDQTHSASHCQVTLV